MLRRFAALAGVTLLAVGLTAAPALAAPVHTAQADASCESGYATIYDSAGYYLVGQGIDKPLLTTTDDNYCWHTATFNNSGLFENEAGQCVGWDQDESLFYLQDCNSNVTWQIFTPASESGGTAYSNLYTDDEGAPWLNALSLSNGSELNAWSNLLNNDLWHS